MRALMNSLIEKQAPRMTEKKSAWAEAVVVINKHRTQNLFSLQIAANLAPFEAGQYTSLALDIDGERVAQPYSILSAPEQQPVEFFFYTQADGTLSARLSHLQTGDRVWVQQQPEGSFTLSRVPAGKDLWLIATGTGVSPFLSMLKTEDIWRRFEHVVLVYAVRQWDDIGYGELIRNTQEERGERFSFVPFVSREKVDGCVYGHIPASISNGTLERVAGRTLSLTDSQLMLCGNPGMVQDALQALEQRGFTRSLDGRSGNITLEAYW